MEKTIGQKRVIANFGKIKMRKFTKQFFGFPVISQRSINRAVEHAQITLLPFAPDSSGPASGAFKDEHTFVAARIVTALALIIGIASGSISKIFASIVEGVVVFMINFFKLRAKQSMHPRSTTTTTSTNVIAACRLALISEPIPLRKPFKVGNVNYRILVVRKRDEAVGFIKRLGYGVSYHTAFHRCTSNALRFGLYLTILALFAVPSFAQVSIGPWVVPQYFNNSGRPCAGCKLASFAAGTSTPLATYSEPSGTFPNANPTIMDSAGRARIYLTGAAYKLVLSDAMGNQLWSVDQVASSNNGLLATNNTWLGTQTFQATTNFNAPANFNVGLVSLGPNILGGGGSISGTYSGSPTFSGVPFFSSGFIATTGTFGSQIISTLADGTAPMTIVSRTEVLNFNANFLEGCDWATPCPIGTTLPNTAIFTTLQANTNFKLNGSTVQTGIQGSADGKLLSAGTFSGATGIPLCKDANGGATTSGCQTSGFTQVQAAVLVSPCTPSSSSTYESCNSTLTWPTAFTDSSYIVTCTALGTNYNISDPSNNDSNFIYIRSRLAASVTVTIQNGRSAANTPTEVDCIAIHP